MSKIANKVRDVLIEMFPPMPHRRVWEEIYVNYKGQKLFFDFYLKELNLYIEVQGRQHTDFVKHFHGDRAAFVDQKHRDNLKIQYVQEKEGSCLIRFKYDEDITEALVRKKILSVLEGECFYE